MVKMTKNDEENRPQHYFRYIRAMAAGGVTRLPAPTAAALAPPLGPLGHRHHRGI